MKHLEAGESGDIVSRSIVCCRNGELINMPPPPQTPMKPKVALAKEKAAADARPQRAAMVGPFVLTFGVACMLGLGEGVKASLLMPLMTVTKAISGMTAVGSLLLMQRSVDAPAALGLGMLAVGASAVNVIGGFVVSQRMLNLFKKQGNKDYSPVLLILGLVLFHVCLRTRICSSRC